MTADAHRTPAPRRRRIRGNAWLQAASAIVLLVAPGVDSGDVRASHAGAGSATSVAPLSLLRLGDRSGDAIRPPALSEPRGSAARRSAVSTVEPLADGSTGLAGAASPAAVSVPDGPSIMALEAAEHARDRLNFAPGGAVTVPFEPESGDRWPVDGRTTRSLPAGSATGIEMAASRQGSVWAGGSAGAGSGNEPASGPTPDGPSGDVGAVSALPVSARVWSDPSVAPSGASGLRRQVLGFLPYWKVNSSTTVLNDDLLSTIAYFGVGVDSSGNLQKRNGDGSTTVGWSGWTSSKLTSIINTAHTKHTRVVLTVQSFSWTSTQAARQAALLDSASARLNLARQAAAAVRNRGADGVNLDFEPIVSGHADEFTAFVRTLRSELNKLATGYQLTFDTTGSIGNYPIEAATAPGGADAIFIMGYDYRTASAGYAGSVDPLNGSAYDLTDTALAYLARVPASKIVLGIPYYGRAWSTVSSALHAKTQTGTKYGSSTSVTYVNAVDVAAQYGRRYDSLEQSAWVAYQRKNCTATYGCVTTWRELYYDDAQSLRARYDLINRYALRGAGIWALGYDGTRPELYKAIADKFLHDTTPPETGIKVLPTKVTNEGFRVSWTAFDLSSIRSYDVQMSADGGPWTVWLTGTSLVQAIYLGLDGHAYAFRARATDSKGNVGSWDIATLPDTTPSLAPGGFAVVLSDTLNVRNRPDTSADSVYQLAAGDVVALTDGPVSADGYTWFQISGPFDEWAPTSPVRSGNWAVAKSSTTMYLRARTAPNSTLVDAGISGLSFGAGGAASLGVSAAAVAARSFSPNGDGSEDSLSVRWRNNVALDDLTLHVFRTDGSAVGTRSIPDVDVGAQAWAWNGEIGGNRVPDGRYMVQLVGSAGTKTYAAPSAAPISADQIARYSVVVDTLPPAFSSAGLTSSVISPNGDGRYDTIGISATTAGGAVRWQFRAARLWSSGPAAPIRTIQGSGSTPKLAWDGRKDDGTVPADGLYRLTLAVFDVAGNAAGRAWDVKLDTTPPAVNVSATPPSISPNGDGADDTTVVTWVASESASATVRIYHGTTVLRTFTISGFAASGAVRWNGKNSSGTVVSDGRYVARATMTDRSGNRSVAATSVLVDRTIGWLRWSPAAFYPQDGDALAKTSKLTFRLSRTATTTLAILDATGTVVRTAWVNRSAGAGSIGWTWNGRNSASAYVAPGRYTAVLTAVSGLGTTTLRRSIVVDAFSVALSDTTVAAGQTITVRFTTIEPLSTRPVVTFRQPGRSAVAKTATLVSTGHYRVSFTFAAGGAGQASIVIAARDSAGGRNRSVRYVTVQ